MPEIDFDPLIKSIQEQKFKPVYILHGEEPFFIDSIVDLIEESVLSEDQKSFNQTIVYGRDVDSSVIINAARRFPMMAQHQLVVVREAQNVRDLDEISLYVDKAIDSTVLVLALKGKALDKRKKLYKAANAKGVIFSSNKIKEYQLGPWIVKIAKALGYNISAEATALITDHLGNDLSRINSELKKVSLNLAPGATINVKDIEQNVGINREFTIFELQNAIGKKDSLKAFRIVQYFVSNPKSSNFSIVFCTSTLYGWFNRLWIYQHLDDKSEKNVMKELHLSSIYAIKDYQETSKYFTLTRLRKAFLVIQEYDLKCKGVNSPGTDEGELLKEMVFKLLHL